MFEGRNVHFSTDNKPLCSFSGKLCKLRRLNGYAFCVRHILEDPTAPFRQCSFVVKSSGQKCTSAIPVAQDRQYCNAHMQVMGFLPKKERKKKLDSFLNPPEGNGLHSLDNYILNDVINGYTDDAKPRKCFSASKLFPELAEKLSADNHPANATGCVSEAGELMEMPTHDLNKIVSKSPSKHPVCGSPPKRSKKQARKNLSIQQKKLLGLLTDDEARRKFCSSGPAFQAYSHYVKKRIYDSELLTSIIDSSDDDDDDTLTYSNLLTNYNLRVHVESSYNHCIPDSLLESDLTANTKSTHHSVDDKDMFSLKRRLLDLQSSASLNNDLISFQSCYLRRLLEALRENFGGANKLVQEIHQRRRTRTYSPQCISPKCKTGLKRTNESKMCSFTDQGTQENCKNVVVPYSNHCLTHITNNAEQRLFRLCMHNSEDSTTLNGACRNPVVTIDHRKALCVTHSQRVALHKVEEDTATSINTQAKAKKKSKSFALLTKKKKKKNIRPQKPIPSSSGKSWYDSSSSSESVKTVITPKVQAVEPKPSPSKPADEYESMLTDDPALSPLEKSLELPLDQADSKLLLEDKEIEAVLNNDSFDIFSDKHDDALGLTDAEADMILRGEDAIMEELKDELPEDITDVILHVESEVAAFEQQQQQQLHQQQQLQQQHHINSSNSMLLSPNNFDMSYNKANFNGLPSSYSHSEPPPRYPGGAKLLPISHLAHGSSMGYHHDQHNNYPHHLHTKMSQNAIHAHAMMANTNFHVQSGSSQMALPPSSTFLDSNQTQLINNRIGERLPPVSTITMPWPSSEVTYQNGYHNMNDHAMYMSNGLPSPTQYLASREHRHIYNSNATYINPYHISLPGHPPGNAMLNINMPLQ